MRTVDLFAGPGGWSEGLRSLGLTDVGIEWDAAACATRSAAGHLTIRADVAEYPPEQFAGFDLCLFSPPCQSFSPAGLRKALDDPRGELVFQPLRWVRAIKPRWVACEQAKEVLPIWRLLARTLEDEGYGTWTGILNAADYGVPQERKRAFLLATIDGTPPHPEPTHAKRPGDGMFGRLAPWVTMADALGLGDGWQYNSRQNSTLGGGVKAPYRRSCDRPSGTVTTQTTSQWVLEHIRGKGMTERHGDRPPRRMDEPSFTVLAHKDSRMRWRSETGETRRFTLADSLALQGFRPDYPVQGSETRAQEQVGNAIPPPFAAAVVGALTGRSVAGRAA